MRCRNLLTKSAAAVRPWARLGAGQPGQTARPLGAALSGRRALVNRGWPELGQPQARQPRPARPCLRAASSLQTPPAPRVQHGARRGADPAGAAEPTPRAPVAAAAAAAAEMAHPAGPAVAAAATAGSFFGAVALITGSTVGAGMLALPSVTAPAGYGPTATLLVGLWGLLTAEALLLAEVNLSVGAAILPPWHPLNSGDAASGAGSTEGGSEGGAAPGRIVTLRQMAEHTLGEPGKAITLVYLGLAYSLLVAYIAKAAEVLDFFAGGGLPPAATATAFTAAMGGLLLVGGTGAADKLNQGLTSLLLGLFGLILASGALQVDWPAALAHSTADWGAASKAVPIIFLSLVYHDLVPVICAYLGGNRGTIRSAIVLGSLVPLMMFLSWEAVSLNLLPFGLTVAGSPAEAGLLPDPAIIMEAAYHPPAPAAAAVAATMAAMPAEFEEVAVAAAGAGEAAAAAAGGGVSVDSVAGMTVDPLQVFVRRSPPLVGSAVEAFSFLAVLTSCIGTSVSLSETLRTEVPPLAHEAARRLGLEWGAACSAGGSGAAGAGKGRTGGNNPCDAPGLALFLTLVPPLMFTLGRPDAFLTVLEYASSYGMVTLYGILPPLMAWRLRAAQQPEQPAPAPSTAAVVSRSGARGPAAALAAWAAAPGPFVPGGNLGLAGILAAAVAIGSGRVATDMGLQLPLGPAAQQLTQVAAEAAPTACGILDATLL